MNKLGAFHFFTVVLPALVLIVISSYLLGFKLPLEFKGQALLVFAIILPISMFVGAYITRLGYWIESFIDKLFGLQHPIVKIFNNYPSVKDDLLKLFPNIDVQESASQSMDKLFDKGRVLLYQQTFSDRTKQMSMLATFYRNIIPIGIWFIIVLVFSCYEGPMKFASMNKKIIIMVTTLGVVLGARYLSLDFDRISPKTVILR